MHVEITHYTDDGVEENLRLPAKWEICATCEGHGTDRGRSVECDGGGFTSSEWAEKDPEFREDYMAGKYDRPCESCYGTGKVKIVDRDLVDPSILDELDRDAVEESDYQAVCAAERRMGA